MPTKKSKEKINTAHKSYALALSYLYKGNYLKAQTNFESIIKKYPEEVQLVAQTKLFLRVCNKNASQQQTMTEESRAELYDAGVYEHNCGQYLKAIDYFNRSLSKTGKDPKPSVIYSAVASSHAKMGAENEALENLKKAIDIDETQKFHALNDPDFEDLEDQQTFQDLVAPESINL